MTGRAVVRWLWIPVGLVVLYSGWIFWSRHASNAEAEERVEQKRAEADRQVLEKLGGSDLKILMFYANPGVITKGERGLLCYGVSNAKSVSIEPAVEGTGPSLSRCVEIRPTKDTTYTLKATDANGKEVTQPVEVKVR